MIRAITYNEQYTQWVMTTDDMSCWKKERMSDMLMIKKLIN